MSVTHFETHKKQRWMDKSIDMIKLKQEQQNANNYRI